MRSVAPRSAVAFALAGGMVLASATACVRTTTRSVEIPIYETREVEVGERDVDRMVPVRIGEHETSEVWDIPGPDGTPAPRTVTIIVPIYEQRPVTVRETVYEQRRVQVGVTVERHIERTGVPAAASAARVLAVVGAAAVLILVGIAGAS